MNDYNLLDFIKSYPLQTSKPNPISNSSDPHLLKKPSSTTSSYLTSISLNLLCKKFKPKIQNGFLGM